MATEQELLNTKVFLKRIEYNMLESVFIGKICNIAEDKAKKRNHTIVFSTQSSAQFAQKMRSLSYEYRFLYLLHISCSIFYSK